METMYQQGDGGQKGPVELVEHHEQQEEYEGEAEKGHGEENER
jgi:hypothetical protein